MVQAVRRVYLDASVLASYQLEDAFTAKADIILRQPATLFVVSDLCITEVSSVVARKVRTRELTADAAVEAFMAVDEWVASVAERAIQQPDDLREANRLIRLLTLGLRTQDAIHAAMARRLHAELATFDAGLGAAARTIGLEVIDR